MPVATLISLPQVIVESWSSCRCCYEEELSNSYLWLGSGFQRGAAEEQDDSLQCLQHMYKKMPPYALTCRKCLPLERLTAREHESSWSPAKCIYQSRWFPAWSAFVGGAALCQAAGELPLLVTASFLTCRFWFLKACAWSCSAEEGLFASGWGQKVSLLFCRGTGKGWPDYYLC